MTVTLKTLVPPKQMEATQTTQYTATAAKALIDKATVTNTDTVNRTFSVNLVQVSDSASNSTENNNSTESLSSSSESDQDDCDDGNFGSKRKLFNLIIFTWSEDR